MRLLVTGGGGFLGGFVLREAVRRGHEVTALARSPAAAGKVRALGARPVSGDLAAPGPAAAAGPGDQARRAGRRAADRGVGAGLDHPAADDDLRRGRRPEPVPAAPAAAP